MFNRNRNFISILILVLSIMPNQFRSIEAKVCKTIHIRGQIRAFEKLKDCTVIEGSLAIAIMFQSQVPKEHFENITFPNLVEITDYLLFYQVDNLLSLGQLFPNLTLIRGQELFDKYALVISDMNNLEDVGLSNLAFIKEGSVLIQNNPELCYVTTVDWNSITNQRVGNEFRNNKPQCKICSDDSCAKVKRVNEFQKSSDNTTKNEILCWSEKKCQKMCDAKECKDQTCYLNKNECCPDSCLGSCYEQQLTPEQMNGTKPRPARIVKEIGSTVHICTICRYVEHNGTCLDECPKDLYKFKDRRCVDKDECIKNSKIYAKSSSNESSDGTSKKRNKESIYYKPVHDANGTSVCVTECPNGYMVNPENIHSCIKCGNKCFQTCEGDRIEKVEDSNKFKKCTHIKRDLVLSIHDNSPNLEKRLEENLGSIETIEGYLRISKSFSIQTLNFFRNLREIGGETLDRGNYSLTVMDNANLVELFYINPNLTQPQLKLTRGRVFFQLNPKLCLHKIFELRNYSNIKEFPQNEVPDFSNGDKAICLIEKINLTLSHRTEDTLTILWTHFKPDDFRTLLGYDIWYKETEYENVTYYDGRDVCNQNDWKNFDYDDVDFEKSLQSENTSTIISQLKPATKYAFFIKANVLVNRFKDNNLKDPTKTGLSDIVYFRTKPAQPSKPELLKSKSLNSSTIEITWQAPLEPNGKIAYYNVQVEKVKEPEINVSNCDEKTIKFYNVDQQINEQQQQSNQFNKNIAQFAIPQQCCKCTVNNEERRMKLIDIENLIANTLYYTPEQIKLLDLDDVYMHELRKNELMISVNSTVFKDKILKPSDQNNQSEGNGTPNNTKMYSMQIKEFKNLNLNINQLKAIKLNITNLAKIGLSDEEINQFGLTDTELNLYYSYKEFFKHLLNETRSLNDPEFIPYLERYRRSLTTSNEINLNNNELTSNNNNETTTTTSNKPQEFTITTTKYTIGKLEHYTHYLIKVRACQNVSEDLLPKDKQCSPFLVLSVNTQPIISSNDIRNLSVNLDDIVEKGSIYVKWVEPEKPNGQITFFKIEYKQDNSNQKDTLPLCVTREQYLNGSMGKELNGLLTGSYRLRIMAVSTGLTSDKARWSKEITFVVPEKPTFLKWMLVIFTIVFLIVISFSISVFHIRSKKKPIYASVNPDYVEYEPDDWEIKREDVKFDWKIELGKGNYGVVYEGTYTKSPDEIIKVAVKTSNSPSDSERNRFLQEASTMKKIKCFHVISLIGVVSKGIPVLVLMELMEKGDLRSYLRIHRPNEDKEEVLYKNFENDGDGNLENNSSNRIKIIKKSQNKKSNNEDVERVTFHQILSWAIQIADGMAYLANEKFVHRDLAARNVLLSHDLIAKVGDFGMTRDVCQSDYYKKSTRTNLPVRWCSPEALRDGVFTSQGDVWSYGIVLYEMVTLGSQPYQGLSNQTVLKFVSKDNGRIEKPTNCPENIYAIMEQCWAKNPVERPSFFEIVGMLLPYIEDKEAKFKDHFVKNSFYYSYLNKIKSEETSSSNSGSGSRSKKDLKKNYLSDKNILQDDGCDEPLTIEQQIDDLKNKYEFQKFNNNSNNNLEKHLLSDFELKSSDLAIDNGEQNSEFSENDSLSSNSQTTNLQSTKLDDVIVEIGVQRRNFDKKEEEQNELKNLKNKEQQRLTNLNSSSSSSLNNNKKSREESISYQSSDTSTSNEENFSLTTTENLIQQQNNQSKIPVNGGNLPNGNILLNS